MTVQPGKKLRVVNCAEIAAADWRFLQGKIGMPQAEWEFYSASPRNWLERIVKRPKLARYRACLFASWRSRHRDFIISHLPRTTWWVAFFAGLFRSKARHLAFSFNFTDLPIGVTRALVMAALKNVDRFVVYSSAEKELYSEYFGIERQRIDVLPWAMDIPVAAPESPIVEGDYICAVGGEGRDYDTLLAAIEKLPDITLALVARPHNISGRDIPDNVHLFTDLPNSQFWNVVKHSRFVVIPLRNSTTNCGHISIVGSMLLGRPVVTTYSEGTKEYINHGINSLVSPSGEMDGLKKNIGNLWASPDLCSRLGEGALASTLNTHSERQWIEYLSNYLNTAENVPE